jgi:hypothetical protein
MLVVLLILTRPLSSFELTSTTIASSNDGGPLSLSGTSTQVAYFFQQTATRIATTPDTSTPVTSLISAEEVAEMTATAARQLQTQVAQWTDTPIPVALSVAPPTTRPCTFNSWATEFLPELTAEIQAALDAAGLENVTVSASAYGENCHANDTHEVVYFAAMKTDFYVTAVVDNLDDEMALGDITAQILAVINRFTPDVTPGPMSGQISLTFIQDEQQQFLSVSVQQATEVIEQGLSGAALWNSLVE